MKNALFLVFFLFVFYSHSQDSRFNFGARNSGLAGASVTLSDQYSLFNNVGGLGRVDNHHLFGGYQNRFGISEFQVIGAGVVYHTEIGNAGFGFYKQGDDLFSQQRLHLAIGHKLQMVSLGLAADLIQYNITTIDTKQVVALEFGGIAEITPQFFFGAHIFNLNQVDLVKETGEKIPTIMKAGLSYRPSQELIINVEVEKDLDFDETVKAGIEYQIIENVFIRTGISSNPFLNAYGLGFQPRKLQFDYSYSHDSNLGEIHEVTLAYQFQ